MSPADEARSGGAANVGDGVGFDVLCICTGNVARSPVAERLLGRGLAPLGVRVSSAGTDAPEDAGIAPRMGELLLGAGIDASDHRARWLSEAEIARAGLVLGLADEHRRRAVALVPSVLRRTFTLNGFAAIARAIPPEEITQAMVGTQPDARLRALVGLAPRYRTLVDTGDIDDPFGADDATYDRVFAEIGDAVATIVAAATGDDVSAPGTPDPPT